MNLYEILEINENASEKEIRKAYHRLALLYHPDKNKEYDSEKFQNINTAYEILKDSKTRIEYNKLNHIQQNNFVNLLQKIFNNSLAIEEVKYIGINFQKKDWKYLEKNFSNLLNSLNFSELLEFFSNGKFPKKSIDISTTNTETDNETDTSICDYYDTLPVYYQKFNKFDIILNLNICLDDLIKNNKKKVKVKRSINGVLIQSNFIFDLNKQYVIFPNYGDIQDNDIGNLIIKLKLPNNYSRVDNMIIIEQNISLYELVYGVDINLKIGETDINISKWVASRDGFYIDINQIKIKYFNFTIKLVLNYEHTEIKQNLLLKHFS
jgi:curved DNA-binding protein CbpA